MEKITKIDLTTSTDFFIFLTKTMCSRRIDVTGRQGMLTPPRHLIPSLVCPAVRACPTLLLISIWDLRY